MKVKNLFAAAAVLLSTATAFAAESPEAPASAGTETVTAAASPSTVPAARGDAKQDAADAVKHYKTPLAIQLDQYKK